MNCIDQVITDRYAAYNGDCVEVLKGSAGSVHRLLDLFASVREPLHVLEQPARHGQCAD